jgi:hypothetical protein
MLDEHTDNRNDFLVFFCAGRKERKKDRKKGEKKDRKKGEKKDRKKGEKKDRKKGEKKTSLTFCLFIRTDQPLERSFRFHSPSVGRCFVPETF